MKTMLRYHAEFVTQSGITGLARDSNLKALRRRLANHLTGEASDWGVVLTDSITSYEVRDAASETYKIIERFGVDSNA